MKALLLGLLAVSALALTEQEYQTSFVNWMKEYSKTYQPEEFFYRYGIFKSTLDYVNDHNSKNYSWEAGLNQFSDLTTQEFGRIYASGYIPWKNDEAAPQPQGPYGTYPNGAVNWVTAGAVTPIKNQQQCGSCWAFSTTGATEGWVKINHGPLNSLSEEQLVQCAYGVTYGSYGCNGGSFEGASKYVHSTGLCSESAYPYTSGTGVTGSCSYTAGKCTIQPYTTSLTAIAALSGGENGIGSMCDKEPVNIAVEADQASFQNYKTGIFCPTAIQCGQSLDHAILVVGYGTSGSTPYWYIKNSWGTTWGEAGYMYMCRNQNCCGIGNAPGYAYGN
jgi:hypothetical protein